jgi:hypothetical protein
MSAKILVPILVLNGMAFTVFGGRATWDRTGKRATFAS